MDTVMVNRIDPYMKGYAAYNEDVSLFEFGEVIVLKNYKETSGVRVVSGGSSCHIEYVGAGMLTASIQGKGTDPPTPKLILRTLRELSVNHVKGILVIGQASSTDLLNFGLAIERADNDDLRVAFLAVSDDCKNEQYSKSEKKGLTGILLVNKIAGALAQEGKMMLHIYSYCSKVMENLISIGTNVRKNLINIRECLYCSKCASVDPDGLQLNRGSVKKVVLMDILNDVAENILTEVTTNAHFILTPGENIVVLINNMGALGQNEQYVFFNHCVEFFNNIGVNVVRFYIGSYLQLQNNMDLTLTLLKVFDNTILGLLDAPCKAIGWKQSTQTKPISKEENLIKASLKRKCRLSPPMKGPKFNVWSSNIVQLCLQFACDALISCEKMLNKMDGETGNGNTGTKLKIVAELLNKRCCDKKLNTMCPFTFFLSLSKLLENTVGGTMGCIYSILFEAAANTFGDYPGEEEICAEMWVKALENACSAIRKYGTVEMGDKTMYDPLEACAKLLRQYSRDGNYIYAFGVGVDKAEEVAQLTRQPGCKYPDAGAHAVGIWLRAVCEGVKLRCYD